MKDLIEPIKTNAYRIKIVSQERITDEIKKTLMSALRPYEAFELWQETGLWDMLFPNMNLTPREKGEIAWQLNAIGSELREENVLLAVLFMRKLMKEDYNDINQDWEVKSLKLSNDSVKKIESYINATKFFLKEIENDTWFREKTIRIFSKKFCKDYDDCIKYITFAFSYYQTLNSNLIREKTDSIWEATQDLLKKMEEEGKMYYTSTVLPINGDDIMTAFNITPGKKVKEMIDEAWDIFYENVGINKADLITKIKAKGK